jgi:hypothetical protein
MDKENDVNEFEIGKQPNKAARKLGINHMAQLAARRPWRKPMNPPKEKSSYCHCLWRMILNQLIQNVTEEVAACEFDCRKPECPIGQWETCERRLLSFNKS